MGEGGLERVVGDRLHNKVVHARIDRLDLERTLRVSAAATNVRLLDTSFRLLDYLTNLLRDLWTI